MERRYYLRGLGVGIAVTALVMGVLTSRSGRMSDQEVIARAKELGMVENTVLLEENDKETDQDGNAGADEEGQDEEEADDADRAGSETGAANRDQAGVSRENVAVKDNGSQSDKAEETGVTGEQTGTEGGDQESGMTEAAAEGRTDADVIGRDDALQGQRPGAGKTEEENGSDKVTTEEEKKELITSAAVKTITVSSGDGSHTVAQKLADVGVVLSAQSFDDFLCQYGYDKKLRTGTFSIPADASDEQIARIITGAE